MEMQLDPDTARKIELINKKIDEINQRRYGLRTTKIEDELDRQELEEYIATLNLTSEQKKLIESFNRSNEQALRSQSAFYYGMMIITVFIEAYLGYAIIDLIMRPGLDLFNTIYLYLMAAVFIVNAFYILKFLRFTR
ncbi:hypothetical protein Mtc_1861 [Methanocella conradii HZ254]|uniref:Uncharacterized protein n=1 Tax=Methanocella conradii (strain DSM 24694 / JCM 17849 / CGMCC 1.5162 / HZ254) TaxID=1041930 RepID=H8IAU7_METCZ|nr:hypothetical protein [Methanocella conradii]AFD00602.1 hypothetical protein Mtc_1861 [Methanocella conradii HZ254]MDI6896299.1 hypothetical protein [Methanocella conradii]